jgi:hypothetical protein
VHDTARGAETVALAGEGAEREKDRICCLAAVPER